MLRPLPLRLSLPCLATLCIIALPFPAATAPSSKFDKNAQSLAKSLASVPPAKKVNPADKKKLSDRMIVIIQAIEKSDRSGNTNAESLMSKAMYFREDMGDFEKLVTSSAILRAWETSRQLGLFNEYGTFSTTITLGRHQGDSIAFEFIIPPERYVESSNQIANLRIVPIKEKRTDAELSDSDLAYGHQLVRLANEQKSFKSMKQRAAPIATNSVGKTKEQAQEAWERALKESEGALDRRPRIRIESSLSSGPSKKNQYRWKLGSTIRNASVHPTEIKLTVYMLGQSDNKNLYYMMAVKDYDLQLRQNEIREIETLTKTLSSYKARVASLDGLAKNNKSSRGNRRGKQPEPKVNYRGNIIIARHKGEVVAFHGSDARLERYADENDATYTLKTIPVF